MVDVTNDTKSAYKGDSSQKRMYVNLNGTTYTNDTIYYESFWLKESIMSGTAEFVGCIASEMKITLQITNTALHESDYAGKPISVSVRIIEGYDDDGDEILGENLKLFHGYVDTANKQANRKWLDITAYDVLTYASDTNCYNAYKSFFNGGKKKTVLAFRTHFIENVLGIDCAESELCNDEVVFRKRFKKKDMTLLSVIKNICQINGCYGIINREGKFDFKYLSPDSAVEKIDYYRTLEYGETYMDILKEGITIRTNSEDAGVNVDWDNYESYVTTDWDDETADTYLIDDDDEDVTNGAYIIESNMIAYKLSKNKKRVMAANIMRAVGENTAIFREFKLECNGLPYVECGDYVRYEKSTGVYIDFPVTCRTLKGIQSMTDTFECKPNMDYASMFDIPTSQVTVSSDNTDYVSNVNNAGGSCTYGDSPTSVGELGLSQKDLMFVVEWDEETGILNTSSMNVTVGTTDGESS